MVLKNLTSKFQGVIPDAERLISRITGFIRGNPIISTGVLSATATGTALAVASQITKRKPKKKPKSKKSKSKTRRRKSKRTKSSNGRRKRKRTTPRTAGKGKDTSTRRIRHTKNGQPYVILRSGKARFIKKSSARRSRKLKGGRY